ncbi:copper chaperone [Rhodobium orientis]|uniref:Heavy metal transport/detoxification protein n=1 Tax=Rhodobium orientis TaxID=34017 RepID=A0A327JRI7_9HYPH|nr:cation transporter [Rhodobium orientis]MBB4304180.1 copper chaperone [Rhodobium orientis]MBK5950651.1 heavy metal transport/detoxification protein [Rhodobium orientis]RAI28034.1 heavy metal transport/detoxification protein [Rhodobium orientis]
MISLNVTGMSCNHCVAAVKKAVADVDPAAEVAIDLDAGRVDIASATAEKAALSQAIEDAGYEVAK